MVLPQWAEKCDIPFPPQNPGSVDCVAHRPGALSGRCPGPLCGIPEGLLSSGFVGQFQYAFISIVHGLELLQNIINPDRC